MQVLQSKLILLLENIGVDGCRSWTLTELCERVNRPPGISRYLDPGQVPPDSECNSLFFSIRADQRNGIPVQVIPSPMPPLPPKPEKSVTVKSPKKAVSTDPDLTWAQRLKGWKKKPYTLTEKGPGIVRTIVETLRAAGKGKKPSPVTKERLLEILVATFPDRDSLNNQVPTQLKQYRQLEVITVVLPGGKRGYYIPAQKKATVK